MTRWVDLTAPAVAAAAADGAVALWPVGATEQHGSHLPTGFDLIAATAVCERATQLAADGVVLLPGLPFGASEHWLAIGATLSLRPETLIAVLGDVIRSVEGAGFSRLVAVNGHHGNAGALLAALGGPLRRLRLEAVSYWQLIDRAELAARCSADGGGIGHAGEVETSIALHLGLPVTGDPAAGTPLAGGPGSARYEILRQIDATALAGGVLGDPRPATAALGAFAVEAAAAALAAHCRG